ncbi:MAG: hypothetical protein IPO28_05655 [Holophagaceae bacterium]|nr:hypothetical protein [Holophagaceae bacterium]
MVLTAALYGRGAGLAWWVALGIVALLLILTVSYPAPGASWWPRPWELGARRTILTVAVREAIAFR